MQSVDLIPDPCRERDDNNVPNNTLCHHTLLVGTNDYFANGNYAILKDANDVEMRATTCKGCVALFIDNTIAFTGNYMCELITADNFRCYYE